MVKIVLPIFFWSMDVARGQDIIYRVVITSGVEDPDGNAFVGKRWTFTTAPTKGRG